MQKLDAFYAEKEETLKSCLQAIRSVILQYSPHVTERWYYRLPCFFYQEQMFCYLWIDRKTQHPYIALYPAKKIHHPALISGNRTQSKILMIDPQKDLPMKIILELFKIALSARVRDGGFA